MKETQPSTQDKVEIVKQVQQKKQKKHVGRMLPGDGHTCFELDKTNYVMRVADVIEDKDYQFGTVRNGLKDTTPRKVNVKENCIYIFALNAKNAQRKLMKKYPQIPFIIVVRDDEQLSSRKK